MRKLMSAWTEQHVPVALALVVAALAGGVATTEAPPYSLYAVAAVVATGLGALFFDAFGGLVLGVAAAAAVVLALRLGNRWSPASFVTDLALVLGLAALGWLVGMVSAGIHARHGPADNESGTVAPAYGSLGLVTAEVAVARLDEELLRARSHGRPLSVVVIRVTITESGLDVSAQEAAQRAVARLVESMLRETDVPFASGPDEFGAILPETDVATAWEVVGPVLDAASRAAFTVRETHERRSLVDCAELHVGLAGLDGQTGDATALLQAARRSAGVEEPAAQSRHSSTQETVA
jgi:GGDEF domain-containing protein